MIFANHLLVPSKTIDFVDSMNVLCSLALNSNVSLDIHLVYRGDTFRSNQQIHLKDCCFKLSQNYTELSCTCALIDEILIVVKIGRAEIRLPNSPFSFFRILIIMRPFLAINFKFKTRLYELKWPCQGVIWLIRIGFFRTFFLFLANYHQPVR